MCILDGRFLLGVVVFLMGTGLDAHGQDPRSSETTVDRERIHIREDDWHETAKTRAGVRIGEAVRLRDGASEGRVESRAIELPFPANGVGLHWDAAVPEGTSVAVALRSSDDGETWSSWTAPTHRRAITTTGDAGPKSTAYSGDVSGGFVLTTPDTRYVRVRLTLRGSERASPRLRRLSLYVVNSTDGPAAPRDARIPAPTTADPDTSKPRIYTRDEWGAQAPAAEYRYHPVSHLAIHHTATAEAGAADTWEDCAAAVRAIQDFHMNTNGWIDIGYNYLVCQTGAIFQGREDGNDRRDVVGAHDGFNEGSAGTGGLGYFHPPENQQPRSPLLDGFTDLFAWIAARQKIDPDGISSYPGYGPLRTVYGHRDVKATACPGDHLYPKRTEIADRLANLVPTTPATTVLSVNRPNPARSTTHFDLQLAERRSVTLTVYDLLGRRVARREYGSYAAGEHTVSLRTAEWASGAYPYRLRVGGTTSTGTIRVVQ